MNSIWTAVSDQDYVGGDPEPLCQECGEWAGECTCEDGPTIKRGRPNTPQEQKYADQGEPTGDVEF